MEEKNQSVPGAGKLGMTLFLAALSVLFAASITGYLVVRSRAAVWPPPGMPRLPSGLWISTLIILLSSATVETALRAARGGRQASLRRAILMTLILGVAFLVSQTINWSGLISVRFTAQANLYAFTFYMLTGLHAAHVIGGLIPLGIVTRNAYAGRYSPDRSEGVLYVRMYWHFLAAVWLVMFVLLIVAA
jgi:cytochrome c oxidase subunit III